MYLLPFFYYFRLDIEKYEQISLFYLLENIFFSTKHYAGNQADC